MRRVQFPKALPRAAAQASRVARQRYERAGGARLVKPRYQDPLQIQVSTRGTFCLTFALDVIA